MMRAALLLFAFSLPLSHVPVQLALLLAIVGWMAEGVLNKKWLIRWHPIFIPMLAYFGWNVLSSLFSPRPAHSFFAVLDNEWPMLSMIVLYWIVDDIRFLKNLVLAFLSSATIAVLYGVWQTLTGIDVLRARELTSIGFGFYRSTGFYGFYLTFAALAMAAFFLSGAKALEERTSAWKPGLAAGVAFLAVVGSFARSIWVAIALILPFLAFVRGRKFGTCVSLALVSIALLATLTIPPFYYRVASIVDLGQNQTRLNLWKSAVAMASDHPILGVGEDNWDYFFELYRVAGGYYDTKVHPHNDYLNVLISSGVPGLIFFLTMWAITVAVGLRTFRRYRKNDIGAIALGGTFSVLGLMVAGMFQNYYGTFVNCFLWWFVVGLIFAASSVEAPRQRGT